jgi:hypothetical protein
MVAARPKGGKMIDLAQAQALEKEAHEHDGICTHCYQSIKVYRYSISTNMVNTLKVIAKASRMGGDIIDVGKLTLDHNERSQLTKIRLHGLIAKVKKDGHQIPRHWVVTTKGWQFLGGEDIPAKVVIYNNQVLGHDGGTTNIKRVSGMAGDFEKQSITEAESRTYAAIRKPVYDKTVTAEYLGYSTGEFVKGQEYQIKMSRLQVGKPLHIQTPLGGEQEYKDVAAFARTWKVTG